jgi:hypothetical protein
MPEWNLPEQPPEPPLPQPRATLVDRYVQGTGVVLDTQDGVELYLAGLMDFRDAINREMDECRAWLRAELAQRGVSSSGRTSIKRETTRTWNIDKLRELPEDVFNRIVEQVTEERVKWGEAKKVAAANEAYKAIIDAALTDERTVERVSLGRR